MVCESKSENRSFRFLSEGKKINIQTRTPSRTLPAHFKNPTFLSSPTFYRSDHHHKSLGLLGFIPIVSVSKFSPRAPAMTDPLSVTAGIAGLFSLGIQVTESLVKFYNSYKSQDIDVARVTTKLENLSDIFRSLSAAL